MEVIGGQDLLADVTGGAAERGSGAMGKNNSEAAQEWMRAQ